MCFCQTGFCQSLVFHLPIDCNYLLAFYFVLLLVWWIWNKQIYRASRRKAVMKHYADVNFNPGKGFLLFFMPLIFFIGVVITICSLME